MNVLHLIDTTGPGGAETVFVELIAGLHSAGYQPTIVLRDEGWVSERIRSLGFEPVIIDSKGSFNIRYLLELVKLVRQRNISLIHAHLLGSNVYGAAAALITQKPMIATFHGNVDVAAAERFLKTKFKIVGAGASAIVCVSGQLQDSLNARSALPKHKLRLIYNGVDPCRFGISRASSLREELGLPPAAKIILSIGNIRPAKGYHRLVEAAAKLVPQRRDHHFVIVGHQRAELYGQLVSQINAAGLAGNIHFLGFREDVESLLGQADFFLLPSISEGFSISTVEAMMSGVPVIATRSGGPEEIVKDNETGILVQADSSQGIVEGIERLESQQFTQRLVQSAKRHAVANFSRQAMLEAYQTLYQEMLRPWMHSDEVQTP